MAALDKFRGTLTARQAAAAVAAAARDAGWRCDEAPVADGGEGTLDALGGPNRTAIVTGPLGDPVEAGWRRAGDDAVVEMAAASGLTLVGGAEANDPIAASTFGTGELIGHAIDAGCRRVVIGVGGSATTDGGLGALRALEPVGRLRGVDLVVACDVDTRFLDAADVFAPQKGATPAQTALLRRRLERLAQVYRDEYGVDVVDLPGSGAAGGLAGGLAAIGARLVPGFELVADEVDLLDRIEDADLVVTGEGLLDEQSFHGKVVGGVVEMATDAGVAVLVVVGDRVAGVDAPAGGEIEVVSLTDAVGSSRSLDDTAAALREVVAGRLGVARTRQ